MSPWLRWERVHDLVGCQEGSLGSLYAYRSRAWWMVDLNLYLLLWWSAPRWFTRSKCEILRWHAVVPIQWVSTPHRHTPARRETLWQHLLLPPYEERAFSLHVAAYQCLLTLAVLDTAQCGSILDMAHVSASGKTSFCLLVFSCTDFCRSKVVFTSCSPRTHCWVLELFSSAV